MKLFFSADLHLGHLNIIEYCNRPFNSLERMNEVLINNWNMRVKPEDMVIYIGDFCFRNSPGGKEGDVYSAQYYLKKLNGMIIPIKGNHDQNNSLKTRIGSLVVEFANEHVYCVHDPDLYNPSYRINLVGHVHQNWKYQIKGNLSVILINVGVDVWSYSPVEVNEILELICKIRRGEEIKE